MRIDNWRNTKKALRQYNCREMDIRFEPESDSGLINEEKSGYQPLQKTKGLRIKFAGNKRKRQKAIRNKQKAIKEQAEGYPWGVAIYANSSSRARVSLPSERDC